MTCLIVHQLSQKEGRRRHLMVTTPNQITYGYPERHSQVLLTVKRHFRGLLPINVYTKCYRQESYTLQSQDVIWASRNTGDVCMDSFHVCLNCCLYQIMVTAAGVVSRIQLLSQKCLVLNVKLQSQNLALFVYSVVVLRFGERFCSQFMLNNSTLTFSWGVPQNVF